MSQLALDHLKSGNVHLSEMLDYTNKKLIGTEKLLYQTTAKIENDPLNPIWLTD